MKNIQTCLSKLVYLETVQVFLKAENGLINQVIEYRSLVTNMLAMLHVRNEPQAVW